MIFNLINKLKKIKNVIVFFKLVTEPKKLTILNNYWIFYLLLHNNANLILIIQNVLFSPPKIHTIYFIL